MSGYGGMQGMGGMQRPMGQFGQQRFNPYGQSAQTPFSYGQNPMLEETEADRLARPNNTYVNPPVPEIRRFTGGPDSWPAPPPTPMNPGVPGNSTGQGMNPMMSTPYGVNPSDPSQLASSGQGIDPRTGLPLNARPNLGFLIPGVY